MRNKNVQDWFDLVGLEKLELKLSKPQIVIFSDEFDPGKDWWDNSDFEILYEKKLGKPWVIAVERDDTLPLVLADESILMVSFYHFERLVEHFVEEQPVDVWLERYNHDVRSAIAIFWSSMVLMVSIEDSGTGILDISQI